MDKNPFKTKFSRDIFFNKYAHSKDDTWYDLAVRSVDDICGTRGGTKEALLSEDIRKDLVNDIFTMKFIPGGRYLYYAGRPLQAVNNCFLLKAESDDREEWGDLIKRSSDCLMLGGGIGIDYSKLRCRDSVLKRTGGKACLPGDTVVYKDRKKTKKYNSVTLEELYYCQQFRPDKFRKISLRSLDEASGVFYRNKLVKVIHNGVAPVYEIVTQNGYRIEATSNHRFMDSNERYRELSQFRPGEEIAVNGLEMPTRVSSRDYKQYACSNGDCVGRTARKGSRCFECREHVPCDCGGVKSRKARMCKDCCDALQIKDDANETSARQRKDCLAARRDFCELCGTVDGDREVHHIDKNPRNNEPENLICLCVPCHGRVHRVERHFGNPYTHKYLSFDRIISITQTRTCDVYDLQMAAPNHNFVANGFVSHNSGPIPLMYSVNEYGRNVMQGGSRRSAIWAGLHWKHGDSKEFLGCKNWHNMPIGKAKKSNGQPYTIADAKQDDFNFHAPLDMTNISLIYDDEFLDEINIGDLTGEFPATYMENCRQAMSTGEPGFSFNFGSKSRETLRNACNEVTSEDDSDVCNLGSVNLGNIDSIRELSDVCRRASMFLVCGTLRADLPYRKVHLVREKNRRLGLGLMGIHEWLLKRSMPYEVGKELSSWLNCYQENSETAARSLCDKMSISRPVAYRAIAPTGSIGILAATTTGIEPLFAVAFKRRYLTDGTKWKYQYVVDATADRIIQETGVDPDSVETAASLASDFERRIKFQYDIQKYVDMSISSTINLPKWGSELNNEDKVGDFAKTLAKYAHGLRGFTCYPDGARGGQPLTPVKYKDAKKHDGVVFDEVDICEWSGKGGTCGV